MQGLKHYKIEGHKVCYIKPNKLQERHLKEMSTSPDPWQIDPVKYTLKEISCNGPVYGWLILDILFINAKHRIYRAPAATQGALTHALMLFGFGSRGRTSAMLYQNNWGRGHHVNGRGLMETNSIIAVIIPTVVRNWD